jgi:hypothetical protein
LDYTLNSVTITNAQNEGRIDFLLIMILQLPGNQPPMQHIPLMMDTMAKGTISKTVAKVSRFMV